MGDPERSGGVADFAGAVAPPEALAASIEGVRREVYAAQFTEMRKPAALAQFAVLAALVSAVPLVPAVRKVIRVGPVPMALAMSAVAIAMAAATVAYHRAGVLSVAHRALERVETAVVVVVGAGLIFASGAAQSVLWFIPYAHASMLANAPFHFRFERKMLVGTYSALVVGFAVVGKYGDAVVAALLSAVMLFVYNSLLAVNERQVRLRAEASLMRERLDRLLVENERRRIARDLHDGIGADITALIWSARSLEKQGDDTKTLSAGARAIMSELRDVVWGLEGRSRTLGEVAAEVSRRCTALDPSRVDAAIGFGDEQSAAPLSPSLAVHVVRSAQELARNALTHADASAIKVRLDIDDRLRLVVEDDGSGLDDAALTRRTGGLANLRTRLAEIGGTMDTDSSVRGTRVVLTLPGSTQ